MPLFLNNKLLFLHIPKTGGTSIEKFLVSHGYDISFFTSTGSIYINGHTPQHCTFKEIKELNLIDEKFKIFTVVRDPVGRVISEYAYLKSLDHPIIRNIDTNDEFLDLFLNMKNYSLFDNHNLSQFEFLSDSNGQIPEEIKIFRFFDIDGIEEFLGLTGLANFNCLKKRNNSTSFSEQQINRIKEFYRMDYEILPER